jgi:hypothetical protein
MASNRRWRWSLPRSTGFRYRGRKAPWSHAPLRGSRREYTTNLAAPVWIDLGSPVTATSNIVYTTDLSGTDQQRFYRVQLVP